MNLEQLQNETREWTAANFPGKKPYQPLLGVQEEVGELAHAHLKGEQAIRHTPEEIHVMKKDAIGDIIIYLADYCNQNNLDLDDCVSETWYKVSKRDWQRNPIDADKKVPF